MRFTVCLLRRKVHKYTYERDARDYWQRRGQYMNARALQLSPSVRQALPLEASNNVIDMSTDTSYEERIIADIKPVAVKSHGCGPRIDPLTFLPVDPRAGQEEAAYLYRWRQRFSQGVTQASVLSNSIVTEGLAPPVENAYQQVCSGALQDHPQDYLLEWLQRCVLRAHVWHTQETKLPRRFRPDRPILKHKPEFGIPPAEAARFLFTDLHRGIVSGPVAKMVPNIYASLVPTRDHLIETFVPFVRSDSSQARVHFREAHDLMLSSEDPQNAVYSMEESTEKSNQVMNVPNVWPFSPLIDLTKTHIYRTDSFDGWPYPSDLKSTDAPNFPFVHPHIFMAPVDVPNLWSDFEEPEMLPFTKEDRKAIAVLKCFAQTVATAHRLYGEVMGNRFFEEPLPKPIVCHGILSDSVFFDFVTFQLNTLRIPERLPDHKEGGLYNFAWVDAGRRLFEKKIPVRSLLRNTEYRNVDIDVYWRILSFYCASQGAFS